jgi:hypothetical protein
MTQKEATFYVQSQSHCVGFVSSVSYQHFRILSGTPSQLPWLLVENVEQIKEEVEKRVDPNVVCKSNK